MQTIYKINGQEVPPSRFRRHRTKSPARGKKAGVPYAAKVFRETTKLVSESAAVHPDQVADCEEHARRSGVPTHFDSEGRPEFRSFVHQEKYLKLIGMHRK